MDVPTVDEHPRKIRVAEVGADPTLEASRGWVDMAVQWIVTRQTVGSRHIIFGVTTMPSGGRHDIHRHPHAEEVEYLVQGEALARVGDVDVRMRAGDVVFVRADESHGLWNTSQTENPVVVWCYGGVPSLDEAGYVHEPSATWSTGPVNAAVEEGTT